MDGRMDGWIRVWIEPWAFFFGCLGIGDRTDETGSLRVPLCSQLYLEPWIERFVCFVCLLLYVKKATVVSNDFRTPRDTE